jgi:DNA-binding NarL/FixJ family response regulator
MGSSFDRLATSSSDGSLIRDGDHSRLVDEYHNCVSRYLACLAEMRAAERRLRAVSGASNINSETESQHGITPLAEFDRFGLGIQACPIEDLSAREFEVFALIGEGLATHEVAKQLNLATSTVETYRERLKSKLKLNSGAALTRHAILWVAGRQQSLARI